MLIEHIEKLRESHKTFKHVLEVFGLTATEEGVNISKAMSDIEHNLQKFEDPPSEEDLKKLEKKPAATKPKKVRGKK